MNPTALHRPTMLIITLLCLGIAWSASAEASTLSPVTTNLVLDYDTSQGAQANHSLKDGAAAIPATDGVGVKEWFDQGPVAGNNIVQQANTTPIYRSGDASSNNQPYFSYAVSNEEANLLALTAANDGGDVFGTSLDGTALTGFLVIRAPDTVAEVTTAFGFANAASNDFMRVLSVPSGQESVPTDEWWIHARQSTGNKWIGARLETTSEWQVLSWTWNGSHDATINGNAPNTFQAWSNGEPAVANNTGGGGLADGTRLTIAASADSVFNRFRLGRRANSGGGDFNGDMGDLLLFNTALNTADRQAVEQYLVTKYQSHIVADWTFDHLAGLTEGAQVPNARRTQDESGNRHHGFYSGNDNSVDVTYLTPTGTAGIDFVRDGSGGVIVRHGIGDSGDGSPNAWWGSGDTPLQPTIGDLESWTIEAIINFKTAGGAEAIIANNGGTGTSEWWWRTNSTGNGLQFLFEDTAGADGGATVVIDTHGTNLINNDDWHHVALVFDRDAGEVRTYYGDPTGGELVGTTPFTAADFGAIGHATRDLEIGQFDGSSARDFGGLMDRLVISNTVLGPGSFVAPVPEPGTFVLMLFAFGGLGLSAFARRR